ncbi:MAG: response regulator [Rhodospirillales bacterium]|nr:response regulator [Rhodospirillales bacterium]
MPPETPQDTHATEIARLRRELARERALLRAVLDNMDEGVVVSDAGFKVVAYNQRFVEYYAVPPEVTQATDPQREMARFMVARGALDVQAAFRTWREGSQGATFEVSRPDGRVLEVHSNPLPEGGFVSTYIDVTDSKRAQAELVRMRQFAEAANDAKSSFLAAMSHEIRTPMNGVLAMLELLHDTGLDAEQDSMVEIVRESASSLLKIIDDILDFSKIEAGKLDLERIEISPRTIVESVVETLAPQARRKGLELTSRIDPRVPATVQGDPVRLRQILFNLVGNAIKFTEDGEVAVAVRPVEAAAPGTLGFFVRDTGIGLDAEAVGRLFRPFSQADTSTTRRFGGTGLGLSISTRLVELMGGRLTVDSAPGRGSTFSFSIAFGNATATDPAVSLAGRRIAIVEPRATTREIFETYLAAAGAAVVCVDDPRRALDLIERAADAGTPFDAVIFDFGLGEIDGLVLGETIRGTPSLFDTRLVLTSAVEQSGLRKKALERGIDAFLLKPVRRDALLRAVLGGEADAAPRPASAVAPAAGGLVLVAEDNPTNRAVVTRQLAKLGYSHEVVADGKAAFERWQKGGLDAILTDCHMPIWDGFELTRQIRVAEQGSTTRTPIVALTANALAGEAERCLAAGMDDFVAKPATLAALGRALANALGRGEAPTADDEPAASGGGEFDFAALKQLYGGDSEELRQVIGLFFENGARLVDEMAAAAAARDAEAGKDAAHALKGASRTIGAFGVGEAANALETAFSTGDWAIASEGVGAVRSKFEAARANLLMALSPAGGALR